MRNLLFYGIGTLQIKVEGGVKRLCRKLSENKGSFLEEVIKYVIYFVVGALLLAGIYFLFKNIVLPAIQTKTQELFNYSA